MSEQETTPCATCKKALGEIVEALDLDYARDFRQTLWDVLRILGPELYEATREDHKEALAEWLRQNGRQTDEETTE